MKFVFMNSFIIFYCINLSKETDMKKKSNGNAVEINKIENNWENRSSQTFKASNDKELLKSTKNVIAMKILDMLRLLLILKQIK